MQLRAQVAKQKQTIKKLEEKSAPRRFDTSKKFSNSKENLTQSDRPKTPLKDGIYNLVFPFVLYHLSLCLINSLPPNPDF